MRKKSVQAFLVAIMLLIVLNSDAQKNPTTPPSNENKPTETQKALFDKFFLLTDGVEKEMNEKIELSGKIFRMDSTSKYFFYVIYWARILSKEFSTIEADIDELLEKHPDFAEGYYLKGQYFFYSKQPGDVEQMQKCIELNPKLSPPYFFIASNSFNAKNYKLSLTYYNLLEKADAKHKSLYYNRAQVKTALQDFNGSIEDYTKALQMQPGDYRILYNRGTIYSQIENYAAAEKDFADFILLKSDYPGAWYNLGLCKHNQNKLREACDDIKHASKLGHKDADAYLAKYCN